MSKPKWKNTAECIKAVRNMKSVVGALLLAVDLSDGGEWGWYITVFTLDEEQEELFHARGPDEHDYEDEAANAGYQHAYKYYRKGA